jgi:hypothetical protein
MNLRSKILNDYFIYKNFFFIRYRNNHQSFSPPKLNISLRQPSHVEFEGEIDDDEHRLNIDDSKEQNTMIFDNDEQSSDDEQVRQ